MDWSRCRLAVLSACLTATGELQGYVNPDSLVRAFLAAGARGVLAASWAIDSRATHLFFENFYRHLLAGRPAAFALQHAATDLRRRTEFAHPYYWAPFQLYR